LVEAVLVAESLARLVLLVVVVVVHSRLAWWQCQARLPSRSGPAGPAATAMAVQGAIVVLARL
jgi:hypothetical protein